MGFEITDMQKAVLLQLIDKYKERIKKSQLKDEIYKWQLLKDYKGKPNLEKEDLLSEIKSIKYSNLIYTMALPVVHLLVKKKKDEMRLLFQNLFNDSLSLSDRVSHFTTETLKIYRELGETLQHHQDERTIATYLTFKNPEKYTFYKYSFYKKFCNILGVEEAKKFNKYEHYLQLLNFFITEYINKDEELINMVKNYIPAYYDGSNHLLLAQDILFQSLEKGVEEIDLGVSNVFKVSMGEFSEENFNKYFEEKKILVHEDTASKGKSYISQAESFRTEIKEGDFFYLTYGNGTGGIKIIGRISSGYLRHDDGWLERSYEILYYSKNNSKYTKTNKWWTPNNNSTFIRIKNDEIEEANNLIFEPYFYVKFTKNTDSIIEEISKTSNETKTDMKTISLNQILYGPPGTGKTYKLKNEYFSKYTLTENSISPEAYFEDVVSTLTWWQVIALALLEIGTSKVNDILENRWVSKKAVLSESKNVRATIWGTLQMHTIVDSKTVNYTQRQTPFIFDKTEDKKWQLFEIELKEQAPEIYDILDSVNHFKPNPNKEIKHYVFTTFHQSFSYEDFIEGIKPVMEEGQENVTYKIENGVFKELCLRAQNDPNNRYAIFIDEINRGNVSQIFGELITLIEQDKRIGAKNEIKVKLPYSKKEFGVPMNVDVIGTMNTADRSVEALDTALRRRFSFVEMMPEYKELYNIQFDDFNLGEVLEIINQRIEALLDRDHTIGHSYFINILPNDTEALKEAFGNKIIPLLQEYFYHDYEKIVLILGEEFIVCKEQNENKVQFAKWSGKNLDQPEITRVFNIRKLDDDFDILSAIKSLFNRE